MNEKQMKANLFFTTFAFILSLAINFYITPLISKNLGDAAYGFVSMANDFVSYAAIISAVLNSVSARFVALENYKNQYEKEFSTADVMKQIRQIWTKELKRSPEELRSVNVYLKPEEFAAYYVINDEVNGKIDL